MRLSLIKTLKSTQVRLLKPLIKKFISDSFWESSKFSENSENLLLALRNNSFDQIMRCNIVSSK